MITMNKMKSMCLRQERINDFNYELGEILRKKESRFGGGYLSVTGITPEYVECLRSYHNESESFEKPWEFFIENS